MVVLLSFILFVLGVLTSCGKPEHQCAPNSIAELRAAIAANDSALLDKFIDARRCQMRQTIVADTSSVGRTLNHVFPNWWIQEYTEIRRVEFDVARLQGGPVNPMSASRFKVLPEKIIISDTSVILHLMVDTIIQGDTLRFLQLSRAEVLLIDSLIRKPDCKAWNDSCFINERRKTLQRFFSAQMQHWGGGTLVYSFPSIIKINTSGSSHNSLKFLAQIGVGQFAEYSFVSLDGETWKQVSKQVGIQE